jgi:predicted secreted hydrolase
MPLKEHLFVIVACFLTYTDPAKSAGFSNTNDGVEGFEQVLPGKVFEFPRDNGTHNGFRYEWWYLTANLHDASNNTYGLQWTLFRKAFEPNSDQEGWDNKNVWMGHSAVTSKSEHYFSETLARGGIGQAGVTVARSTLGSMIGTLRKS